MGLSLSFGAFACGYLKSLVRVSHSFKQGFKRFLKLNQRSVKTKPNRLHRLVLGA
ncbi:sodium:proton antiporter [Helicobacter pylori]|nr:sodium:proton antiporter [Helicobacter pylori]